MGTSQSSPGPGGNSPLVPPWADDQPQQPLPEPEPARFKEFRQYLGRYTASRKAGSRDSRQLEKALRYYARKSTGGGSTATRRMGSVTRAGASLYGLLTGGFTGAALESTINLTDLVGQPCDLAIASIIRALTIEDGDKDKIQAAMNHALSEALEGTEIFDLNFITDEVVVNTMISYLAESVFLQIVMDAGKAWNKAESAYQAGLAESDLRELVKVVVDKKMSPMFTGNIRSFNNGQIVQLERNVIAEVWKEWEDYQ